MTDPRIEALYRAGVNARRPTAAQAALMDRMMRDLESVPDSTISDLDAAATEIAPDPEVRPYYGRRPGTRARMDGTPAMPGEEFASPEEAAAYTLAGRDPVTGARTASPHAAYMMDELNLTQEATPSGPVFRPSAAVPPMVTMDGMINPTYLRRMEMTSGPNPMWESGGTVPTPEGGSTEVLVPSTANRKRMAEFEERQRRARMGKRLLREADRAGVEVSDDALAAADADSVAAMRMRAQAAAESSLRQQRMFAGGAQNLNAGNVNQIRELIRLRDTDPETYNAMLAENMRPRNFQYRIDPRTGGVSYTEETAFPPVSGGPDTQVNVTPMQEQMMDTARRQNNPTAAGADDLRKGEYASPQADMVLGALAERFDTTTGGFSYENENALAQHLVSEFGVPPEEAARLARRAANKRRRFWSTWFQPPPGYTPSTDTSPPALPQTLP